jgi:hypothetical protein
VLDFQETFTGGGMGGDVIGKAGDALGCASVFALKAVWLGVKYVAVGAPLAFAFGVGTGAAWTAHNAVCMSKAWAKLPKAFMTAVILNGFLEKQKGRIAPPGVSDVQHALSYLASSAKKLATGVSRANPKELVANWPLVLAHIQKIPSEIDTLDSHTIDKLALFRGLELSYTDAAERAKYAKLSVVVKRDVFEPLKGVVECIGGTAQWGKYFDAQVVDRLDRNLVEDKADLVKDFNQARKRLFNLPPMRTAAVPAPPGMPALVVRR